MWQNQTSKSSFSDSIKTLEADIQHANTLSAALPRDYCGNYVQMRLSYSPFAPLFLFLIEWMDYSCTDTVPSYLGLLHVLIYKVYGDRMLPSMSSQERKATLREFYAIIYPSLGQLQGDLTELDKENLKTKMVEDQSKQQDQEREDECGICMETCTKMVLPYCGHSMCISCFHDWNSRSESCPFCRGSLKRVSSRDLWVLTSNGDVIDKITLAKENLRRFSRYIESLPLIIPDTQFFIYEYMI